ncbi:MAG: hypothetical protein QM767_15425 [Anaeromyxobacter sp.]
MLPGGLDAYPECRAKGVLVRALLDEESNRRALEALPAGPLLDLVRDPPMAPEWIPEVHFAALFLAAADLRNLSDETAVAQSRQRDTAMFQSPAYRIMLAAATPERLLRMSSARWANFHRGSQLELEGIADDGVRIGIRFPLGLYDRLLMRAFGQSFAAALELSRAHAPIVEVEEAGLGYVRYRASWAP